MLQSSKAVVAFSVLARLWKPALLIVGYLASGSVCTSGQRSDLTH